MNRAVRPPPRFDAIVIGASAGAIGVLSVLLPALASDLRCAVLVVVHIPRERPSLLANVFSLRCALQVKEAEDKEPVLPGWLYFAPPDYHLLVDHGPVLALSVDEPLHHSRPAIDVLFESAAEVFGPRLLGIILTGANEDGASGLAAVRRHGGTGIVQAVSSAEAPAMPTAALRHSADALVMTPQEMATYLAALQ